VLQASPSSFFAGSYFSLGLLFSFQQWQACSLVFHHYKSVWHVNIALLLFAEEKKLSSLVQIIFLIPAGLMFVAHSNPSKVVSIILTGFPLLNFLHLNL